MEKKGPSRQSSNMYKGMKKINNWKQIIQVSSRKGD